MTAAHGSPTTPSTTPQEARSAAAAEHSRLEAAALVVDIHTVLDRLLERVRLVRTLTTSRQTTGMGFLTAAAIAERDQAIEADRTARRAQPDRPLGLKFINRSTSFSGTGTVPAAGTVPAISADAQIAAALHHQIRRIRRYHLTRGVCLLHFAPPNADTGDLITYLRSLVTSVADRRELRAVLRDLEQLLETADQAANGPARTAHDQACPHCGRRSLVVHHRLDLIRCDKDQADDTLHPCTCDDRFCDCQRHPLTTRHEWHRTHATAPSLKHTWSALNNLLTINRELTAMETKALDAVQRVRDLHQPGWCDAAGTWHDHYVTVVPAAGRSKVPDDHVCRIGVSEHAWEVCVIDTEDPEFSEHAVLACVECRQNDEDGEHVSLLYPCPTIRALEDPAAEADQHDPEAPTTEETR